VCVCVCGVFVCVGVSVVFGVYVSVCVCVCVVFVCVGVVSYMSINLH